MRPDFSILSFCLRKSSPMSLEFLGSPLTDRLFAFSPFTAAARMANVNGAWVTWGDNALPEFFAGIAVEVAAIRNAAMLEDKSPLAKIHIHGPDAERFINRLIPRDATRIAIDHAYYTPWCDDHGKVIVEGMLLRLSETDFIVTAGLMNRWLSEQRGWLDVDFEDVTDRFGILALQGPSALSILQEATGQYWSDLEFSRGRRARISSAPVHVWRTGFTGVKGYEFWVPPEAGNDVWEALVSTPTGASIEPCGHASQDIVRVEAGMVLPAIDYARAGPDVVKAHSYGLIDDAYRASPYEINLGRFVDFEKGDFVGRNVLVAEGQAKDIGRRMWAMRVDWRQLVLSYLERDEMPIVNGKIRRVPPMKLLSGGRATGYATSIGWSSNLKEIVGFAHLPAHQDSNDAVFLRWDESEQPIDVPVSLSRLPFVKPSRK